MAKNVLVPIADGSEEIEAVCVIDTLRRAGAVVTVASVGQMTVTASRGVRLVADTVIADCTNKVYDLIALPGGMPGAEHLRDCKELTTLLKEQKQAGRLFAAICASPAVVLAHHGLIDGLKATCHPAFAGKLGRAKALQRRVVVDGNCVTSQGPGTALEFALKLAEMLYDGKKAKELADGMVAGIALNICRKRIYLSRRV